MFIESSHYLRLSDRNYRCDLDCRGKCKKKEPQLNKENMERNFIRYTKKFIIPDNIDDGSFMIRITKDTMHEIIEGNDWDEMVRSSDRLEDTLEVIKSDVKEFNKIEKNDIETYKNQYSEVNTVNHRLLLTCTITGVLKSFTEPENETQMAKDLSYLCKRIYIDNSGKIKKILLERWSWYIINLINKKIPGYLKNLEKNGVKIINDNNDEILSLDIKEAVNYFSGDKFEEALHSNTISTFYNLFSLFKTLIDPVVSGKSSSEQKEGIIKGFEQMNNPIFMSLMQVMQVSGIKLKKKIEKNNEKNIL